MPRTCVMLEHAGAAVIEQNTIHHCGTGENYASGIAANISVNARIAENTVYANPGDAVTLAPNAQRSRALPHGRERRRGLLRRRRELRLATTV